MKIRAQKKSLSISFSSFQTIIKNAEDVKILNGAKSRYQTESEQYEFFLLYVFFIIVRNISPLPYACYLGGIFLTPPLVMGNLKYSF